MPGQKYSLAIELREICGISGADCSTLILHSNNIFHICFSQYYRSQCDIFICLARCYEAVSYNYIV